MAMTGKKALSGKILYSCDSPECGKTAEPWGPGWFWCGSINDLDDGKVLMFCSLACAKNFRRIQFDRGDSDILPIPEDSL